MANIELYISRNLCDIGTNFSVRINRQLINPAELNTKDAQYSYTIELPATDINNKIMRYANVEESTNKFNRIYLAQLIVNGVLVFDGNFIVTNITRTTYKGNLYRPALKSISDVFGETKMNEVAPMPLAFGNFAEYISMYNNAAVFSPQSAIFPYVLYGLLPKVPATYNGGTYSAKTVWDSTVRIGIQDFPPSMNPLKLIRHFFNSRGYDIQGSAFNDARLTELYMSYRNDPDFVQPWNYGYLGKMHIHGIWHSWYDHNLPDPEDDRVYEKGINSSGSVYSTDLLDSTNSKITVIEDNGGNVSVDRLPDLSGNTWTRGQISVPVSGFYKVTFFAQIHLNTLDNFRYTDPDTGVQHISEWSDNRDNVFNNNMYEIHLLRDKKSGDFGVGNPQLAGTFYKNNQFQEPDYTLQKPSYFPQNVEDSQINMIDAAQNDKIIAGMAIGQTDTDVRIDGKAKGPYYNPKAPNIAQVLIAKPAFSWDSAANGEEPTLLAVNNPGYWKYGELGDFDNEGDNPDGPIDYSGGERILDSILNMDGLPVPDAGAAGWSILNRFPLSPGYDYVIDGGVTYEGYCYVFRDDETEPAEVLEFVGGVVEFDTAVYLADGHIPKVTFYLITDDFSVDGTLTITRVISDDSDTAVGWEVTNRYKIDLINAPITQTRRGYYDGVEAGYNRDADTHSGVIIWLEAGELLTVASVTHEGGYRRDGMHTTHGLVGHRVEFDLQVEPFRNDKTWLKVNTAGRGTAVMDWEDDSNFTSDTIDLVQFLPNDIKIDDFIDNFCKAFNLRLSQTGANSYSLDVKQVKRTTSNQFEDIDAIASVVDGINSPIGLPTYYKIGFTVDTEEEGYVRTQDDGGGEFYTGAIEGNVIEQKSTFSYNWFKQINKTPEGVAMQLPIISDNEPWVSPSNYRELMPRRYTDKAFRFWYHIGLLNDLGVELEISGAPLSVARVGYEKANNVLNYKNVEDTILDNFFTLLVNTDSHYTEVEGYVSQIMYDKLDGTRSAKFNGDLYYIAEISGYDPAGVNKTKLKLIRRT